MEDVEVDVLFVFLLLLCATELISAVNDRESSEREARSRLSNCSRDSVGDEK